MQCRTFGDLDLLSEIALLSIDLDMIVQELLKCGSVKDLVRDGTGIVDDEFVLWCILAALSNDGLSTGFGGWFSSRLGLERE